MIHRQATSAHEMLTQQIERAKTILPHGKYVTTLNQPLRLLSSYAEEKKASRLAMDSSLDGVRTMDHENMPGIVSMREQWEEGAWQFTVGGKALIAANLSVYNCEYEEIRQCAVSFVVGESRKHVEEFLGAYHKAKWSRNRETPCVLNYSGDRIDDFRRMKWENIYLSSNMRDQIRGEIKTFFGSQKLYEENNLDWKRGILLAGRPGNGKTAICRAIATTATVPVVYCSLDDGDMFSILNSVARTIKNNAPCISIFEDADTMGSNSSLRSALLNMLDGLFTAPGVMTIASTNSPEKLDEAFTGRPSRFDSFYVIGDPEAQQRREILVAKLGRHANRIKKKDMDMLVAEMKGLSAAFVQEVATNALLERVKNNNPLDIVLLLASLKKVKRHMNISVEGLDQLSRGSIGFAEPKSEY